MFDSIILLSSILLYTLVRRPKRRRIPEAVVCRILVFMWPFGLLVMRAWKVNAFKKQMKLIEARVILEQGGWPLGFCCPLPSLGDGTLHVEACRSWVGSCVLPVVSRGLYRAAGGDSFTATVAMLDFMARSQAAFAQGCCFSL